HARVERLDSVFYNVLCDISELHSFPTRRSSDLQAVAFDRQVGHDRRIAAVFAVPRCQQSPRKCRRYVRWIGRIGNETQYAPQRTDRKSTRLNSSHVKISYAVFCLKKKKKIALFH